MELEDLTKPRGRPHLDMSVSEKLSKQASRELNEDVLGAAMVVPPGGTLYRAYAPGGQVRLTGPIV